MGSQPEGHRGGSDLRIDHLNGAYNSHEEAIKGSITEGKLADFVVLAENPFEVDPAKIIDRGCQTVVGSITRYQA